MKTFKKNLVHEDKKQNFNLELTDNTLTITHTFDDEETAYYAAKDFINNLYKKNFYKEDIEETENTKELNASYDTEEGCILIQDVEDENEAKEAFTEIIELLTTIKEKGDSKAGNHSYYKSPFFELGELDYLEMFEPHATDLEFYELIAELFPALHPQLLENIDLLHEHTDSFGLPVMTKLALTDQKYLPNLSSFISQKDLTVLTEDEKKPKEYIESVFEKWGWSSESIQLAVICVEKKLFSIEELSKKMQAAQIDTSLFATFQEKIKDA